MSFRIGITDYVVSPDIERSAFPEADFIVLNDEAVKVSLKNLDGLLVWHNRIGTEIVSTLPQCKIVVRYGVGFDNIDVSAIERAGKIFCNTPDYGTEEVADTAAAMILNFARGISYYDGQAKHFVSGWQENTFKEIRRTNVLSIGVVGVGRIGTALMNRLRPFGVKLFGFDPYQPSGHEKAVGYHRVGSLEGLIKQSDIISLHCPLNDETRGLVDRKFIDQMKPSSILVNTARGQLLQSLDVVYEALKSKKLLGVGLDVLPEEPPPKEHILISAWKTNEDWIVGRLLINPHSAYFSKQAWQEMRFKCAETARMYLMDGIIRNQVTSKVNRGIYD